MEKWTVEAIKMTSSILTVTTKDCRTHREHLTHVATAKTSGISISPILQRSRQDDSTIVRSRKFPSLVRPLPRHSRRYCRIDLSEFRARAERGSLSFLSGTYVRDRWNFTPSQKYTRRCNARKKSFLSKTSAMR